MTHCFEGISGLFESYDCDIATNVSLMNHEHSVCFACAGSTGMPDFSIPADLISDLTKSILNRKRIFSRAYRVVLSDCVFARFWRIIRFRHFGEGMNGALLSFSATLMSASSGRHVQAAL